MIKISLMDGHGDLLRAGGNDRLLLVGAFLILVWGYFNQWVLPNIAESLGFRWALASAVFAFVLAERRWVALRRHNGKALVALCWIFTAYMLGVFALSADHVGPLALVILTVVVASNFLIRVRLMLSFVWAFAAAQLALVIWNAIIDSSDLKIHMLLLVSLLTIAATKTWIYGIVGNVERTLERERKAASENAKWVSVGQISAGLAHEINTPLSTIMLGTTDLLKKMEASDPQSESVRKQLQTIHNMSHRIQKVVATLMAFYRKSAQRQSNYIPVENWIDEFITLAGPRLREHRVELVWNRRQAQRVQVYGCESELIQILLNLLDNSLLAMKHTERKELHLEMHIQKTAFELRFSDNGCGIESAHASRIFEPFYTGWMGNGTGLGLSMNQDLMARNQGAIELVSHLGPTTFSLTFQQFRLVLPATKAS